MDRLLLALAIFALLLAGVHTFPQMASAAEPPPHAPASQSWLPHGYGSPMYAVNSGISRKKGYWGFRDAPRHIGAYSIPLWGWDVNGYYKGPQRLEVDPCDYQLPIGLIYPENTPYVPQPARRGPGSRRVARDAGNMGGQPPRPLPPPPQMSRGITKVQGY
jgi:hypothetical protein